MTWGLGFQNDIAGFRREIRVRFSGLGFLGRGFGTGKASGGTIGEPQLLSFRAGEQGLGKIVDKGFSLFRFLGSVLDVN